jgi:hypothetical protein
MKTVTRLAAGCALLASLSANAASDPIVESFERMFNHAPSCGAARTAPTAVDPLQSALVIPLRDRLRSEAANKAASALVSSDPLLASFERMFAHEPLARMPAAPAGFESDPLVAAVVEPLQGHVAGHAIPGHLAHLRLKP